MKLIINKILLLSFLLLPSMLSASAKLQVYPEQITLVQGETRQVLVQAQGDQGGASLKSVSQLSEFRSRNPRVVRVSPTGLVEGGSEEGEAIIQVNYQNEELLFVVNNKGPGQYVYFQAPNEWRDVYFYTWKPSEEGGGTERAGPWPGSLAEPAFELGGTWYRYRIAASEFDRDGKLYFIFSSQGRGQSPDLSFRQGQLPYFGINGSYGTTPQPSAALEGTQIQVKGGSLNFAGARNLTGKIFLPGQSLVLNADSAAPGQAFIRWEGAGAAYLLDPESASTELVVGPGPSLTLFAVFDAVDDPFAATRAEYRRMCAGCHGADGRGSPPLDRLGARYDRRQLAAFIDSQMPKYSESQCVGRCATDMAEMLLRGAFDEPEGVCQEDSLDSMVPAERSIRLLTRVEYQNTVRDLLKMDASTLIQEIVPEDFIVNHFQTDSSASFSHHHAQAYFDLAQKIAEKAPSQQQLLPQCQDDMTCVVNSFGKRAFRRPLSMVEQDKYSQLYRRHGFKTMLAGFLASPQLLYRTELGIPVPGQNSLYRLSDYEVASLLSYTYWKSMPDDIALAKAEGGQLNTAEQIAEETRRLLASDKGREAFKLFWQGWLRLRKAIPADLPLSLKEAFREETLRFADYIVFDKEGSFDDLLLSPETFVNFELAQHYGLPYSGDGWIKTQWPDGDRLGVLGKAHYLAVNGTTTATHPVKRGLFIREMLLCQDFPPPPVGAELKPVRNPELTTREKFEVAHRQDSCLSCHQFIDGVGFGLESYDQTGLLRDMERVPSGAMKPIQSDGEIGSLNSAEMVMSAEEPVVPFSGIRELSQLLESSRNGRACFARQFYRYAVGERVAKDQSCTLRVYGKAFREEQTSILELLVAFTQTKNFTLRR